MDEKLNQEWQDLKEAVKTEKEKFQWWSRTLASEHLAEFFKAMRKEIEHMVLTLEDTEKSGFDEKKAQIKARRWMLSEFERRNSDTKYNDARSSLHQFEINNSLFIAEGESGKVVKAKAEEEIKAEDKEAKKHGKHGKARSIVKAVAAAINADPEMQKDGVTAEVSGA